MSQRAYYNEIDPYAAQWLRNLIAAGHLPAGDVDERSITDVRPDDIRGYRQCHFFAGIGGWPYALRLAGWPDDREVWTGSCPCQPLSSAGQRKGHADERHLWPAFFRLISECRPATIFGEQVASKDGREWFAGIRADLEDTGYACGAADLCAAGAGAPHIRQRLFWVADADHDGHNRQGWSAPLADRNEQVERISVGDHPAFGLADADGAGSHGWPGAAGAGQRAVGSDGLAGGERPRTDHGGWRNADWLFCRDGKWRPVERGSKPLVDGLPRGMVRGSDPGAPIDAARTSEARVMRLRGYGNAIVPQVAAEFISAVMA